MTHVIRCEPVVWRRFRRCGQHLDHIPSIAPRSTLLHAASGTVAQLLQTQLRSLHQRLALMGYAQLLRRPLHDALHGAVEADLGREV